MDYEMENMVYKQKPFNASQLPQIASSSTDKTIQTTLMKSTLFASFVAGIVVKLLPCEEDRQGNPVPTVIFDGLPSSFQAFVISIIFAFSGSFSALLSRGKPKYAKYGRFCLCYSLISMMLAIAILVYAVSLACFRSVPQGMRSAAV